MTLPVFGSSCCIAFSLERALLELGGAEAKDAMADAIDGDTSLVLQGTGTLPLIATPSISIKLLPGMLYCIPKTERMAILMTVLS